MRRRRFGLVLAPAIAVFFGASTTTRGAHAAGDDLPTSTNALTLGVGLSSVHTDFSDADFAADYHDRGVHRLAHDGGDLGVHAGDVTAAEIFLRSRFTPVDSRALVEVGIFFGFADGSFAPGGAAYSRVGLDLGSGYAFGPLDLRAGALVGLDTVTVQDRPDATCPTCQGPLHAAHGFFAPRIGFTLRGPLRVAIGAFVAFDVIHDAPVFGASLGFDLLRTT